MASIEAGSSSSSKNALAPIENSRSPCYLNNGDYLGIRIVPDPLIGDNYQSWRRFMTIAFSTKNKLRFVNGTILQPTNESDPIYSDWQRCNDLVISWITNYLSQQIYATVLYVYIAKEVWDDLQQIYSQSSGIRVHHLKQAIAAFKQENLSISDYFTHLKGLWNEFLNYRPIPGCTYGAKCICGLSKTLIEYQHYNYVHSFLMGLNESFAVVRGQFLLMKPLPGINKVLSLIQNHEKQKGAGMLSFPIGLPSVKSTALVSRMDNGVNQGFVYPNFGSSDLLSRFDNSKQFQ